MIIITLVSFVLCIFLKTKQNKTEKAVMREMTDKYSPSTQAAEAVVITETGCSLQQENASYGQWSWRVGVV